jgi:excisionase family DNA binding protein
MPIINSNETRVMTTARETELARGVLSSLEGEAGSLVVERAGQRKSALPPEIGKLLQHVLAVMARGGTVTVSTVPKELTTTAAAEVLGISRPTLMKMIGDGAIPAHRVGTHHRLHSEDVFAALRARRARERAAFAELLELEDDEV